MKEQLAIEPVTLEVIRHGLVAAAEQMASSIERSARSLVIREMLDYSTGIFDVEGGIVAQSTRIPMHLNSMTRPLEAILRDRYPISEWREGDVFVTNDPYSGGQHLPDIMTFSPIVVDGQIIAISGALGHHLDVGGRGPGSYGADATEIYQEGLQLPPIRVIDQGHWNPIFLAIFEKNIRVPDKTVGDLRAQVASLTIGAEEVKRLAGRYGSEVIVGATKEFLDQSRRSMEAAIEALPEGVYRASDVIDGDGLGDEPVPIQVAVSRHGKKLRVDFTGSSPQVRGPINCPIASTESAVYYAVTVVLQAGVAPNRGAYEPIEVIVPEGCVLHPRHPAPVVGRNVFTHRVANITMAALGEVLPERACAHHYGNSNVHTLHHVNPNSRKASILFEIGVGGWGGRPGKDGPDGLSQGIHNLTNNPIELVENEFPCRITAYQYVPDSGGPGQYRGGLSILRTTEILEPCEFSAQYDRMKFPAPGLHGGQPGAPAELVLEHNGDLIPLPGKAVGVSLEQGDLLHITTQGGGGLGHPEDRKPERVLRDVALGKVTAEAAVDSYGLTKDALSEVVA